MSGSEREPADAPPSRVASLLWVVVPALLILAALATLFDLTR